MLVRVGQTTEDMHEMHEGCELASIGKVNIPAAAPLFLHV
jgi:hypothetical protein